MYVTMQGRSLKAFKSYSLGKEPKRFCKKRMEQSNRYFKSIVKYTSIKGHKNILRL